MDAGKPSAKLHVLCTLPGVSEEYAMDDAAQFVPDSSFGSFSSENDDFAAEYSGKESTHRSPQVPKKMSRYFKQKLKKTPNTLKRMTEQHRINERRRHNSLNSSIESLARLIPGHFNSQDTKVSILQKLLAYICFLEQKVLRYSKELGIETTYKRRYLSDYMASMKALDELPEDESQLDINAPAVFMHQDAEGDLSHMNEDSLADYIRPSDEAAQATLILVENGYFMPAGNQPGVEYFRGNEQMDTKYELVYADLSGKKPDVSQAASHDGRMHMEVVKQAVKRYGADSTLTTSIELSPKGIKQEQLTPEMVESDLNAAKGSHANTLSAISILPDSTMDSEERPLLILRDGRCPSWMSSLMALTKMRRDDLTKNLASGLSSCIKQQQVKEDAVLWCFED